jgi:hypothetical protein
MDLPFSIATRGARMLGAALGGPASRQALGATLRLLRQSAQLACASLPGEAGLECRELANKLAAFAGFQRAPELLRLAAGAEPISSEQLPELLRRAGALGAGRALWAAEGLSYALAERAGEEGRAPDWLRPSLETERARTAQPTVPLHTGAALSFARRLLAAGELPEPETLARWLAAWKRSAQPGYETVAVEALGLVARNLYPHLVSRLAAQLAAGGPLLAEAFWHGAGRGLYFTPTHALPFSAAHSRAFEKARREPPDEAGRRNATAGLAWALTLVNLRDPEVLADVLRRHGREIAYSDAFADGVAAAVLVWLDALGYDAGLRAFLTWRPAQPGPAALWRDLVLAPCDEALRLTYPRLCRSGGMAALFRCPPAPRREAAES